MQKPSILTDMRSAVKWSPWRSLHMSHGSFCQSPWNKETHTFIADWFGDNWTHQHHRVSSNDPGPSISCTALRSTPLPLAPSPPPTLHIHSTPSIWRRRGASWTWLTKWTQQPGSGWTDPVHMVIWWVEIWATFGPGLQTIVNYLSEALAPHWCSSLPPEADDFWNLKQGLYFITRVYKYQAKS